MASFHVNSLTGKIDPCEAPESCLFGDSEAHYGSIEAARATFFEKYGAPAFTLTKNLAKKLDFGSYGFSYISKNEELEQQITFFVRSLEHRSYTGPEKQKSLEHINSFMNELYSKRYEATEEAVYARGAYDHLARKLERFGVPRAPRDDVDVFIDEMFEAGPMHRFYNIEFDEEIKLQDEAEAAEELLSALTREARTWTPAELRLVAKAVFDSDPRLCESNRGLIVKDVVDVLKTYREYLDRIDQVKEYSAKYDELPKFAQEAFTLEDAEAQIEKLQRFRVFPESYYNTDRNFSVWERANSKETKPLNEMLATITSNLEYRLKSVQEKLANAERYHTFMAELERRLEARKAA